MGISTNHGSSGPAPNWPGPNNSPPPPPPQVPPAQQVPPVPPVPPVPSRRRKWPWLLAAALVIFALVAGGLVFLLGGDSRFAFATASIDAGTAQVQTDPDGAFAPLADGASLRLGDTLRTGEDARLTLRLSDGSLLRLGAAATATFETATGNDYVVRLVRGDAWYRATDDGTGAEIGVASTSASIGAGLGVAALSCAEGGQCALLAIAGSIDLIPADSDALPLAPGERVGYDGEGTVTEVGVVADGEATPWVQENLDLDDAAGLPDPPAPEDRPGVLSSSRIEGAWEFLVTITESTADNFAVGDESIFDIDLAPTCAQGRCEFAATFGRYGGSGSTAPDGTVSFSVTGPLQCVNSSTGAVTVADNGPETLSFTLSVAAAELRDGALVATALTGTARYEKDVSGPCRPGDQVGAYFTTMDVRGTLG